MPVPASVHTKFLIACSYLFSPTCCQLLISQDLNAPSMPPRYSVSSWAPPKAAERTTCLCWMVAEVCALVRVPQLAERKRGRGPKKVGKMARTRSANRVNWETQNMQ